ncbi:MAG: hypothetical protein QGF00_08110 [Planctomycetota bacterium]|nr:hypothetical protein [Planctomycetota bacterium]MDP7249550.1 hypothetical protein [Planctomycetota bacterium]
MIGDKDLRQPVDAHEPRSPFTLTIHHSLLYCEPKGTSYNPRPLWRIDDAHAGNPAGASFIF